MTRFLSQARPLALAVFLAFSAFLSSCAEIIPHHAGVLDSRGSAIISVPLDAIYRGEQFAGSGEETAQVVATAFKRHLARVEIKAGAALSETIGPSGGSDVEYLVMPMIIQWEDRDVKERDREDHVEIGIRVLRTRDGATLASGRVKKPSKVSTMFRASPAEQLAEPLEEYVDGLFRRR